MSLLPRMHAGRVGGETVIEISQPTVDVTSATPTEMLFSSQLDVASALEVGSISVPDTGTASVSFSYGGVPFITYQIVFGSPATAVFPAIFNKPKNLYAVITDTGVTFHNETDVTWVVNYQIWNKELT